MTPTLYLLTMLILVGVANVIGIVTHHEAREEARRDVREREGGRL